MNSTWRRSGLKYTCKKEAGRIQEHECPECGSRCEVEKDIARPPITGFASAMSWHSVPKIYDLFFCPNNEKAWHQNLMAIREELSEIVSPSLRTLIIEDIATILIRHKEEIK